MSITEHDWRQEQQRVDLVTEKIEQRIRALEEVAGQVRAEVVDMRKNFWDEVTVNLSSFDDIVETHFSIRQQAQVLSDRERLHQHSAKMIQTLTRLAESPYFGRIDFTEQGMKETETIYIGISSFRDEENDEFLIYDWRAPICSLYYDYVPGPVQFQAPGGTVSGTMSLKRQFVIRDARIKLMFDASVTIGDELLMQVLSRHSDAQMKSIVATIQREQNQIIRNDKSRLLIVQGAAGSGKTSAALQRVAYLLYKYRGVLKADQMVLFSPNPLFSSYVSTVLPELGEENMQQATFQEYLEHRLSREYQLEDPFAQLEYILTATDDPGYEARIQGIQYKSSIAFLNAIRSYQRVLEQEGMVFRPVTFRNTVIVSPEQMSERFYSFDASTRLSQRMELLRDWLLEEVSAFGERELNAEWVEEEVELLDPEDYQRAYRQLRQAQKGKSATFNDFDQAREILSRMVVRDHLKPVRRWIRQLQFVDVHALYRQLFANQPMFNRVVGEGEVPDRWAEVCRQTVEKLDRYELSYEDTTPFLFLKELVQGLHINTTVRHVIVDEAQDYSPFQLEFLKRLFPRARMTVLGDLNQAIYAHGSALGNFEVLSQLYGPDETEVIRLTRSYRSTREIVEFTRGMVPGGEEIVPFNRPGDKPRVTVVPNPGELLERVVADVEALQASGYEAIAVICKTASESAEVHEALKDRLNIHLVTKFTPKFEKGVLVVPAYLAKGVEFDAVIIYNGSDQQYGRESERKLFYTACTRAMHRLNIYAVGEPSPFITEQDPNTYVLEEVRTEGQR